MENGSMLKGKVNIMNQEQVNKCMSATYNVIYTNGIVINYGSDLIDYMENYEHKFSKSVYKCLKNLDKQSEEYFLVVKKRVGDIKWYSFTFDCGNVAYTKLQHDIFILEMSFLQVLTSTGQKYPEVRAKIQTLESLCAMACTGVNGWIKMFPENIPTSLTSQICPYDTFSPLKLKRYQDTVKRLYGMFGSCVNFNSYKTCQDASTVVMSRLTSFEFILKIIERAKDMEAGISEEEREKINHRLSVNKLQEHFKGVAI